MHLDQVLQRARSELRSAGAGLVDADVRHLVERSVVQAGVAPSDIPALAHQAWQEVSGFGPLQALLDDPSVEEIWVNGPDQVFVARSGCSELTAVLLSADELRSATERMLALANRRVDLSSPFADASLPDGSRLHVAIPDVTRKHWSINIRKFSQGTKTLADLVNRGSLPQAAADELAAAVKGGANIIVAGATQAGKTTMMNALLNCLPTSTRVITCEETFELRLAAPDWVAMQTRQASLEGTGEITLRRLVREALRMRPERIVVGEVRQDEALDLLVAMNSGLPAMCSLHANSARDAISKMCLLPLLAGSNVSAEFVTPTVASVVDLVVFLEMAHGIRRVREICSVSPEKGNAAVVPIWQLGQNELVRK